MHEPVGNLSAHCACALAEPHMSQEPDQKVSTLISQLFWTTFLRLASCTCHYGKLQHSYQADSIRVFPVAAMESMCALCRVPRTRGRSIWISWCRMLAGGPPTA